MAAQTKTTLAQSVAILVDGGFFLKRYPKVFPGGQHDSARTIVAQLYKMARHHVDGDVLYRIFFYDCPPIQFKAHNPVSKRCIDFGKTKVAVLRREVHEELRHGRKVALRLGHIQSGNQWLIRPRHTTDLISGKLPVSSLTEDDVFYDFRQKGVDMRIGIDIASLAYKRLVQKIVLIAGDCDVVPAAKLARREGIDFLLDPMWNPIHDTLFEHIDGLMSACPRPPPHAAAAPAPTSIAPTAPASPGKP